MRVTKLLVKIEHSGVSIRPPIKGHPYIRELNFLPSLILHRPIVTKALLPLSLLFIHLVIYRSLLG
jgi:hypothetical protein